MSINIPWNAKRGEVVKSNCNRNRKSYEWVLVSAMGVSRQRPYIRETVHLALDL